MDTTATIYAGFADAATPWLRGLLATWVPSSPGSGSALATVVSALPFAVAVGVVVILAAAVARGRHGAREAWAAGRATLLLLGGFTVADVVASLDRADVDPASLLRPDAATSGLYTAAMTCAVLAQVVLAAVAVVVTAAVLLAPLAQLTGRSSWWSKITGHWSSLTLLVVLKAVVVALYVVASSLATPTGSAMEHLLAVLLVLGALVLSVGVLISVTTGGAPNRGRGGRVFEGPMPDLTPAGARSRRSS